MKNIYSILKETTNEDLIQIANELNMTFVPCDGLCRKIASEVCGVAIHETTITHLLGIAPALSLELSNRLNNLIT